MFFTKVANKAKQAGVSQYLSGSYSTQKILQIRDYKLVKPNIPKINEEKCVIKISPEAPSDAKQTIKKIYKQIKSQTENIKVRIKTGIVIGDKFPLLGQFIDAQGQGTVELSSRQGQILLLVVFNEINCRLLKQTCEFFKTNGQKQKIRIVAIGVYQDIESLRKLGQNYKQLNIQILNFKYSPKNFLIAYFGQVQLPFYCLVDQQHKIRSISNETQQLQKQMKLILQNKKHQKKDLQIHSQNVLTEQEINQFLQVVDQKKFQQIYSNLGYFCTNSMIKLNAINGKLSGTIKMSVYYYKQDQNRINQFTKNLSKKIQISHYNPQMTTVPKVPQLCVGCKNKLTYPLYWCKWSQNPQDFRCRRCVQKKQENGNKHYSYCHNSILLTTQVQKISCKRIGDDIQPKEDQLEYLQPHQYLCNGRKNGDCNYQVGQARYICLGCYRQPRYKDDFIDLCQNCLQNLINGQKAIVDELQIQGHDKSHCWLRILYNVKGYYNF